MMKFIATIRDKEVSLAELKEICNKHLTGYPIDASNNDVKQSFCYALMRWIEYSLDTSFSSVSKVIDACQIIISGGILKSDQAWYTIIMFHNYVMTYLPYARRNDEWPSCKELLNLSEKELFEKAMDFIRNEKFKKDIRSVLKIDTAIETVNVVMLTLYYLELYAAIEYEKLNYPIDPYRNKQRLSSKFLQELDCCNQVLLRTGMKLTIEKKKELQEAQKKYAEQTKSPAGEIIVSSSGLQTSFLNM